MGRLRSINILDPELQPNSLISKVVASGQTLDSFLFKYGEFGEFFVGQMQLAVYSINTTGDEEFYLSIIHHYGQNVGYGNAQRIPSASATWNSTITGYVAEIDLYDTPYLKVAEGYKVRYHNNDDSAHTIKMQVIMK